MAVAAFTFVPMEAVVGPFKINALNSQQHLMEQLTELPMLAYLRELQRTGGDPASVSFCDVTALLKPYINWTQADFFKSADSSSWSRPRW